MIECGLPAPIRGEQGFVDDLGRFFNREDALIIATQCKQIIQKHGAKYELYSEDIY